MNRWISRMRNCPFKAIRKMMHPSIHTFVWTEGLLQMEILLWAYSKTDQVRHPMKCWKEKTVDRGGREIDCFI
jgi:hypothetical protein